MKHSEQKPLSDSLVEMARSANLSIDEQLADRLVLYLLAILQENERINVTAIRNPSDALRLHVLDSLLALPDVLSAPEGPLLDIGTGGGFPGIPLALAGSRDSVLLDSVKKKADVVQRVASGLGLNVSTAAVRAEEYALQHAGEFAVVVARAVAPLPALIELARPLLVRGGLFIALKGDPEPSEVSSGDKVAAICGMRRIRSRRVGLPNGDETRTLISYEVEANSKIALPRRVGKAQSEPLA